MGTGKKFILAKTMTNLAGIKTARLYRLSSARELEPRRVHHSSISVPGHRHWSMHSQKKGMVDLTVLDISVAALAKAKLAMGDRASMVNWLHEDIVEWKPSRTYALWHDRAVFHFLVEENDRRAYLSCLNQALHVGGHAIIATFALDGPDECSGLPVQKYSSAKLSDVLGPDFELIADKNIAHKTPWGSSQAFQYSLFKKIY